MNISKDTIKLIAADLDGTLLNNNKEISKYNQKILKKLINDYNVQLILSSGRPYESIKKYNEILNNKNNSIIFNGASIVDENGEVIYRKIIDKDSSKSIIELTKKYNVCIHVYENGKYIISDDNFPIKSYVQREKKRIVTVGLENIVDYEFDKILILGERDILDKLKKEIDYNLYVHSCYSGFNFLEIISKDSSKGNSLKFICESKGINPNNVAAFGDNFNDIEMIEYAGVGVAMANAEEEVKQKADYIALSNDKDGVGKFLSKVFNI